MIHTTLETCEPYRSLNKNFAQAFDLLKKMANEPFVTGKQVHDGDELYSVSLLYDTKGADDVFFEAHKKYIDIMLIVEGQETIGYLPSCQIKEITKPYDADIDASLAKMQPDMSRLSMVAGDVAIFYPDDYHAPGIDNDGKHSVKKIIMKCSV